MTMSRSSSVSRRPCSGAGDRGAEVRACKAGELVLNAGDGLSRSIESSIAGSDGVLEGAGHVAAESGCCEAKIGTRIGVGDADGGPHDGLRVVDPSRACIGINCGCSGAILSRICWG